MAFPDAPSTARSGAGSTLTRRDRRPVLVTGVPRSGTTWLARELAGARHAALPGREPMNPRTGQFALAGTLDGWTELGAPTPQQRRILARCYRGLEVRTFSRYGKHQLRSLLPWSRTVVKDPFALLSVPAIVRCTSAVPVILYRYPGAVLASYRRMGWVADTEEIRRLQGRTAATDQPDDVRAMVDFWNFLHSRVLDWLDELPDALLVSHAEVSLGGAAAVEAVMRACGLEPPARGEATAAVGSPAGAVPAQGQLHGFARSPDEVVDGWRARLDAEEVAIIEHDTKDMWESLEGRRFSLT